MSVVTLSYTEMECLGALQRMLSARGVLGDSLRRNRVLARQYLSEVALRGDAGWYYQIIGMEYLTRGGAYLTIEGTDPRELTVDADLMAQCEVAVADRILDSIVDLL